MTVLGTTWLVVGAWLILGARNLSRNRNWAGFVVTLPSALMLALVLATLRGGGEVRQTALELGLNAAFLLLFIMFFPRASHHAGD